jgi:hypothetical protein
MDYDQKQITPPSQTFRSYLNKCTHDAKYLLARAKSRKGGWGKEEYGKVRRGVQGRTGLLRSLAVHQPMAIFFYQST